MESKIQQLFYRGPCAKGTKLILQIKYIKMLTTVTLPQRRNSSLTEINTLHIVTLLYTQFVQIDITNIILIQCIPVITYHKYFQLSGCQVEALHQHLCVHQTCVQSQNVWTILLLSIAFPLWHTQSPLLLLYSTKQCFAPLLPKHLGKLSPKIKQTRMIFKFILKNVRWLPPTGVVLLFPGGLTQCCNFSSNNICSLVDDEIFDLFIFFW